MSNTILQKLSLIQLAFRTESILLLKHYTVDVYLSQMNQWPFQSLSVDLGVVKPLIIQQMFADQLLCPGQWPK